MKLQCKREKDKGLRILCNGSLYIVGLDGALCRDGTTEPADLPEQDAAKLLQSAHTWEPYGTQKPAKPPTPAKPKMALLDSRGDVVDTGKAEVEAAAPTLPAGPEGPVVAPDTAPPPGASADTDCSPTPGDMTDPPIPQSGGEWADPKPEYSMAWLRACARAYQIRFGPRSSAATLCEKITAAMYGSGEE